MRSTPNHQDSTGRGDWVHIYHSVLPVLSLHKVRGKWVCCVLCCAVPCYVMPCLPLVLCAANCSCPNPHSCSIPFLVQWEHVLTGNSGQQLRCFLPCLPVCLAVLAVVLCCNTPG